ncbi:MAG TPA: DUF4167 domain-containing protein [Alphaproteobacteria bacterium]|nr:DUF4167 domain-containing protein [Alphaproteobacteria bacterium]
MRQGPNSRRSRGRGSNNPGRRSNLPNRNQTFDSNGPDVRIRGNAHQVHEKYLALARDASASGDRVMAENYMQHAEHYHRIINAMNEAYSQAQQQFEQANRGEQSEREEGREPVPNGRDGRREAGGRDQQVPRQRPPRDQERRDQAFGSDLFEDPRQSDDQEIRPREGGEADAGRRADRRGDRGARNDNGHAETAPENGRNDRDAGEDRVGLERIIRGSKKAAAEQRVEEPDAAAPDAAPQPEEAPKPRRRPGRPRKTAQPAPETGGEPAAE